MSREWFEKLHGYFATDWSHMWLPYNGKPNQIRVDRDNHMKHSVTDFDEENERIVFSNNILGNYSFESFFENFLAQTSPFLFDSVSSQIKNYSKTDSYKCINIVDNIVNKHDNLFWIISFDGSKSSEGAGAGCILVSIEGEKTMITCKLEFDWCRVYKRLLALTSNTLKCLLS